MKTGKAGIAALCAAAWMAGCGTVLAAPSDSGALHVEGTKLVDSEGEPVVLRGISTHGLSWFPDYVNEACFEQLHREWKADVVRLAMYTAEYGGYCTGGDQEALKQLVQDGVEYAKAQDMYVIIDWHILSDANPQLYREEARAFFDEMSERYADEDHILYEICNEPNGGTSWQEVKDYAEEIIPVIRSHDEDAVILVGTPNWCQFVDQAAADPIEGYENIMYTLHFYAATHKEELRSTLEHAVEAGLPVFVSEYGICDASGNGAIDAKQAEQWVSLLDAYDISYVAWNLSNKDETSSILKSTCTKTSGFEESDLSASGQWLYQMLTGKASHEDTGTKAADSQEAAAGMEAAAGGIEEAEAAAGGMEAAAGGIEEAEAADSQEAAAGMEAAAAGGADSESGGDTSENAGVMLTDQGLVLHLSMTNNWEAEGKPTCQYQLALENTSGADCSEWTVQIPFQEEFELVDGWNGTYTVDGNTLHIASLEYNGSIPAGSFIGDIGFIVKGGGTIGQ